MGFMKGDDKPSTSVPSPSSNANWMNPGEPKG